MEYGTLFAQSSHFVPNCFLSATSSLDVLFSVRLQVTRISPMYSMTSVLPKVMSQKPDSITQDPLPNCQGNHPINIIIPPV